MYGMSFELVGGLSIGVAALLACFAGFMFSKASNNKAKSTNRDGYFLLGMAALLIITIGAVYFPSYFVREVRMAQMDHDTALAGEDAFQKLEEGIYPVDPAEPPPQEVILDGTAYIQAELQNGTGTAQVCIPVLQWRGVIEEATRVKIVYLGDKFAVGE